jgi:ABC-type sugar transport system ATPase subunit
MEEEKKDCILYLRHILKTFPGATVLDDVHFTLKKGENYALMRESGAGKSTFIKIITGVYLPNRGDFLVNGKPANIRGLLDAQALGVAAIITNVLIKLNNGRATLRLRVIRSSAGETENNVRSTS